MCESGACGCRGYEMQCRSGYCGPGNVDYAYILGYWAKKELLKEKVKKRLEGKYGKKLDDLADAIVDLMKEKSKGEDEEAKRMEELDDKMASVFGEEEE